MVVLGGVAVSYERGTPVSASNRCTQHGNSVRRHAPLDLDRGRGHHTDRPACKVGGSGRSRILTLRTRKGRTRLVFLGSLCFSTAVQDLY